MAATKGQQANGAKKLENGRTAKKQSETGSSKRVKTTKKVQSGRKQAKKCKKYRGVFCWIFLLPFEKWLYSGGHLGFF